MQTVLEWDLFPLKSWIGRCGLLLGGRMYDAFWVKLPIYEIKYQRASDSEENSRLVVFWLRGEGLHWGWQPLIEVTICLE